MNLSEENKIRLEQMKKQISMEREYRNKNIQYALINNDVKKKNNFGFTNVIFISILLLVIIVGVLLIVL